MINLFRSNDMTVQVLGNIRNRVAIFYISLYYNKLICDKITFYV